MNEERIRELARQAGLKLVHDEALALGYLTTPMKKFAELIVRECGQVLVDNTPIGELVEDWDKGYDRAMNDCIHHIYEHFGIEE